VRLWRCSKLKFSTWTWFRGQKPGFCEHPGCSKRLVEGGRSHSHSPNPSRSLRNHRRTIRHHGSVLSNHARAVGNHTGVHGYHHLSTINHSPVIALLSSPLHSVRPVDRASVKLSIFFRIGDGGGHLIVSAKPASTAIATTRWKAYRLALARSSLGSNKLMPGCK